MTERHNANQLGELLRSAQGKKARGKRRAKGRAGAASVHQGSRLERWLIQHTKFRHPDTTLIYVPPRYRIWRDSNNQMRATPVASTWVDFIARLPDGRHCDFEAKGTTQDRWALDERLLGYQGEILKREAARGSAAFVYVRHLLNGGFTDFVVPVTAEGLPLDGRKSVSWRLIDRWRLPEGASCADCVAVWSEYNAKGRVAL